MKILYFLIKIRYSSVQGILFVFGICALYSCVSLKRIGIEVAILPEYPIAEDIQSLVLLNRSMTNQFTNNKIDSLEKVLINKKMEMDTVFQDSIAADTVIQVAAKALFESGRFDAVVPKERNIVRTDIDEIANPLNTSFINEICSDFKVDAALILESFAERLDTKYYLNEGAYFGKDEYSATTDITYKSEWRLYRPNNLKLVVRFQIIDSIFWKGTSISLEDVYSRMPQTKAALVGGGIAAGLKISEFISPKWINQNRYYFLTGNKEIDAAIPLIKKNKWEDAAAIWAKFATATSKSIRSKVEFNLALAAEMNGDLEMAMEWGVKSYKTKYTKAIEVYLITLDKKKKAQQKETKQSY